MDRMTTSDELMEEIIKRLTHRMVKRRFVKFKCVKMRPPTEHPEYTVHIHTPPMVTFWRGRYAFVLNEMTEATNYIAPKHLTAIIQAKAFTWMEVMAIVRGMEDE